jgi:S1/P1 Nuclease
MPSARDRAPGVLADDRLLFRRFLQAKTAAPDADARGRVQSRRHCLRTFIALSGAAIVLILTLAPSAGAWGCKGHQVVALLAEKHLTPHALATANEILRASPIDPNLSRFCKEGGEDAMADASTWPDDVRTLRPETPPWHYIDIPLGTTRREVEKYCDPHEH